MTADQPIPLTGAFAKTFTDLVDAMLAATPADQDGWRDFIMLDLGSLDGITPRQWWAFSDLFYIWVQKFHGGTVPPELIGKVDAYRSASIAIGGGLPDDDETETFFDLVTDLERERDE
jgi:hypothetical protein